MQGAKCRTGRAARRPIGFHWQSPVVARRPGPSRGIGNFTRKWKTGWSPWLWLERDWSSRTTPRPGLYACDPRLHARRPSTARATRAHGAGHAQTNGAGCVPRRTHAHRVFRPADGARREFLGVRARSRSRCRVPGSVEAMFWAEVRGVLAAGCGVSLHHSRALSVRAWASVAG
jgi:hypothetical protein